MDEMVIYCDTCCLVKLFTQEMYTDWVRQTFVEQDKIVTTRVALPELFSAFSRRYHQKQLTQFEFETYQQEILKSWEQFNTIEFDEKIAAKLVAKYNLRGCDATHLSSVLSWQRETGLSLPFCSFDKKLLQAAKNEGLPIIVPDEFTF